MLKKVLVALLVFSFVQISAVQGVLGAEFFGVQPKGTPSVLNYAWKGLTLGAFMGTAAGYLSYDRTSTPSDMAKGAAYGSLVGVGGGIILGMVDVSKGRMGTGAIVLRDMHLGGVLGLVVGGIFGGIKVADDGKWEHMGNNMAWGYLAGTVVGLGIALYEGPKLAEEYGQNSRVKIVYLADSNNRLYPSLQTEFRF